MQVWVDGVGVFVGVIDGVEQGVTDGVLTGVWDGVIVNETVGVIEGVGEIDCVYDGVSWGVGKGAITCTDLSNCGKLVTLTFVIFSIDELLSYKHSNTLVSTCGAVCSFILTKQLFVKIVLKVFLSSIVKGAISLEVIISVCGFNVPVNLKAK